MASAALGPGRTVPSPAAPGCACRGPIWDSQASVCAGRLRAAMGLDASQATRGRRGPTENHPVTGTGTGLFGGTHGSDGGLAAPSARGRAPRPLLVTPPGAWPTRLRSVRTPTGAPTEPGITCPSPGVRSDQLAPTALRPDWV